MRTLLSLLIALAPLTFAADDIAWGPAKDGMRLGIALDMAATPQVVRVLIQNTSTTARDVTVNQQSGAKRYTVEITATSPGGKSYWMYDSEWGMMPFGGHYSLDIATIVAGGSYEFRLLLTDRVTTQIPPDPSAPTNLATLLRAGYSIHAETSGPWDPHIDARQISSVKLVSAN